MATEAQLIAALRQADAAGDHAGATRIAQIIQQQRAPANHTDPVTGYLTTAARAIPGLTELGAGYSAAVRTADDAAHGRPLDFGARFDQARQGQQGVVNSFQSAHPIASANASALGTLAPVAATLVAGAPAVAARAAPTVARGLVARAGQVASTGLKNAAAGSAVGAVYGAAQPGTLQQRATNALGGIGPGAVMGVAFPAGVAATASVAKGAANAFGAVAPRVGSVLSEAADAAGRALTGKGPGDQARPLTEAQTAQGQQSALAYLQRTGVTPEQLEAAKAASGGKPITTAEAIGPQGISQATGLARRAGTTPQTAEAAMTARANDRPARILNDIHETTGVDPVSARGDLKTLVANGRAAAAPLYDAAYAAPAMRSDQLDNLLSRPSMREALGRAISIAKEEGRDPKALGLFDLTKLQNSRAGSSDVGMVTRPTLGYAWTPQTLDYVKRGLDDTLEQYRDGVTGKLNLDERGRAIQNTLQQFRGIITDPSTPTGKAYGAALDKAGDYLSTQDAYQKAKGALFSPSRDPRDFADWFQGLTEGQQQAARASAANDVFAKVNNGQLQPGTFAPPTVHQKLVTLFGADAAQALVDRMATEAKMSRASARLTPNVNSVTGDVLGSDADRGDVHAAISLGGAGMNALAGRPVSALKGVAAAALPFVSAASQPASMATRNALGALLYQDPAATAAALRSAGNAMTPAPVALPPSITALKLAPAATAGADAAGP